MTNRVVKYYELASCFPRMRFPNTTLIAAGCLFMWAAASSQNLSAKTVSKKPHVSPPWQLFWQELHAAFRNDPCVYVDELQKLEGSFLVEIHTVCTLPEKAKGLSALFTQDRDVGGYPFYVDVYDIDGVLVEPTPLPADYASLAELIDDTFDGNPFYRGVKPPNPYYDIFIVFSKEPIQYFGDDLSKPDRFRTVVAADAFQFLMGLCDCDDCFDRRPAIGVGTVLSDPPPK